MFMLYWIAFAAARKPYRIGRLFTHTNADFGSISVTERSYTELISEGESHVGEVFILYWIAFQVGSNSVNIAYVSKKRGTRTFRKSGFGWVCVAWPVHR